MGEEDVQRAVVVLSSGRAGTSVLMQVLGALGMTLSKELIGGRYENPDGFFEDARIVELHKQLLEELGSSQTLPLPRGWLEAEPTRRLRPKFRALVQEELGRTRTMWGFKDPRTCGFLPLWLRILNGEKVNPVFILAMRDPASVVSSFARIYSTPPELAELVWLNRTCDALHHSAGDCYVLHYEDWFDKGLGLATDLLRYTGLERFFQGDVGETIRPLLKPNLNRATHDPVPVRNEHARRLYEALKECRGAEFDRGPLMQVVNDCRRAMDGFSGWYLEAQKGVERAGVLKTQAQALEEKADKQRERLEARQAQVEELKADLQKTQEAQEPAAARIRALEAELKSARNDANGSRAEREMLADQLAKARETHAKRTAGLQEEAELARKNLRSMEGERDAALKDAGALRDERDGLAQRLAELQEKSEARLAPLVAERDGALATMKILESEVARLVQLNATYVKQARDKQQFAEEQLINVRQLETARKQADVDAKQQLTKLRQEHAALKADMESMVDEHRRVLLRLKSAVEETERLRIQLKTASEPAARRDRSAARQQAPVAPIVARKKKRDPAQLSPARRKVRKLVRTPGLFFSDWYAKVRA